MIGASCDLGLQEPTPDGHAAVAGYTRNADGTPRGNAQVSLACADEGAYFYINFATAQQDGGFRIEMSVPGYVGGAGQTFALRCKLQSENALKYLFVSFARARAQLTVMNVDLTQGQLQPPPAGWLP